MVHFHTSVVSKIILFPIKHFTACFVRSYCKEDILKISDFIRLLKCSNKSLKCIDAFMKREWQDSKLLKAYLQFPMYSQRTEQDW